MDRLNTDSVKDSIVTWGEGLMDGGSVVVSETVTVPVARLSQVVSDRPYVRIEDSDTGSQDKVDQGMQYSDVVGVGGGPVYGPSLLPDDVTMTLRQFNDETSREIQDDAVGVIRNPPPIEQADHQSGGSSTGARRTLKRPRRGHRGGHARRALGKLRFGHLNINKGWKSKHGEIKQVAAQLELDVIGVVETNARVDQISLKGYDKFPVGKDEDRVNRLGSCIFVKHSLHAFELEPAEFGQSHDDNDWKWVGISTRERKVAVAEIYLLVEESQAARYYNTVALQDLQEQIGTLQNNGWSILLMGDFNGHIGDYIQGNKPGVDTTGRNILALSQTRDLVILNAAQVCRGLWTWHRGDQHSVVDYIVVSQDIGEVVTQLVIDDEGENECQSDHNWIWGEMTIHKGWSDGGTVKVARPQWNINEETDWDKFRSEMDERLNSFDVENFGKDLEVTERIDKIVDRFADIVVNVGKETVGETVKKAGAFQYSTSTVNKIHTRRQACSAWRRAVKLTAAKTVTDELRQNYEMLRGEAKEAKQQDLRDWDERQLNRIRGKDGKIIRPLFWRYWKAKIKRRTKVDTLKRGNEILRDPAEIKTTITEHYSNLYQSDNRGNRVYPQCPVHGNSFHSLPDEEETEHDITDKVDLDDVEDSIGRLQRGKAIGRDRIPAEFLKEGGVVMNRILVYIFNLVQEAAYWPKMWRRGRMSMLHKGGKGRTLHDYRTIMVGSTVGKVLTGIIHERWSNDVEVRKLLGEIQNGFRKDRRTHEALFILTQILEGNSKDNISLAFLDVRKAYDRVNREKLWGVLRNLGYGGKLLRLMQSMYSEVKSTVTLGGIETDEIDINIGLLQGCVLSPLMFALYIKELGDRLIQTGLGVKIEGTVIPGLFFADDIVLIGKNEDQLHELLKITSWFANIRDLAISDSKSMVMIRNRLKTDLKWTLNNSELMETDRVVLDEILDSDEDLNAEVELSETDQYRYLGVVITNDRGMFSVQAQNMKSRAESLANQTLGQSAASCNRPYAGKVIWECVSKPKILYGTEIFILTRKATNELTVVQNKLGRKLLKLSDKAPQEAVLGELGWRQIEDEMRDRRVRLFIFLNSLDDSRWSNIVLKWVMRAGKSRWWKQIQKDLDYLCMIVPDPGTDRRLFDGLVKAFSLLKMQLLWKSEMLSKSTLTLYRKRDKWGAYEGLGRGKGNRLVLKARTGDLETHARTHHWDHLGPECRVCGGSYESVTHIVMECEGYRIERRELLQELKRVWSDRRWDEWQSSILDDQVAIVLGLLGKYDAQQMNQVGQFLARVWEKRKSIDESITQ